MYPYITEFLGTTIFIFLGLSVNASYYLKGSFFKNSNPLYLFFGWGLAYSLTAFCFFNISGAYFNPIIPISLATIGIFNWIQVPGYIIAELLGSFLGALLMFLFYKDQFDATSSPEKILSTFTSDAAIANMGLNLWDELIAALIFIFFFVSINQNFTGSSYIWYGIIIFALANSLGGTTKFAINPAADLMPRLVHQILPIPNKKDSNWGYAIVPVVGPLIGGILGALLANWIVGIQYLYG